MSETNVPEMTDEPEWNYPHEMWLLPDNAHTYGERMTASRVKYIRAEPFPAMGASAMRDAASVLAEDANDAIWDRDTGEQIGQDAVALAIRALPLPDHAALLADALRLPEIDELRRAAKKYTFENDCYNEDDTEAMNAWRAARAWLATAIEALEAK